MKFVIGTQTQSPNASNFYALQPEDKFCLAGIGS